MELPKANIGPNAVLPNNNNNDNNNNSNAKSNPKSPPPTSDCVKRLKQEWKEIVKSPPDYIIACPHPSNILEWHFIILGPDDSPYSGGVYHGSLKFKYDYPLSPPSTPSGRFEVNTRLCLSISDFHPGIFYTMNKFEIELDNDITYGSISTTKEEKLKLAKLSQDFNKKDTIFCEVFPYMVEEAKKE